MANGIRMTHSTALVLQALSNGRAYGFDIMDATGLPGGTIYPALRRLEAAALVESDITASSPRPRPAPMPTTQTCSRRT